MSDTRKKKDTLLPVFDYEDFLHRIDGDVDLLKEVIEIFLEDTPALLEELYTAIKQGDAKAVERAAHTLKGATANISAKRLHSLTQQVQRSAKNNDIASSRSWLILALAASKTISADGISPSANAWEMIRGSTSRAKVRHG